MPITVKWYNEEKTILLEIFEGQWTLVEYRQLIDEAVALLATVDHTVHIIADASTSGTLPGQMTTGILYAIRQIPLNQGLTVFVDADLFTRVLIQIASKLSAKVVQTTFTASSIEDAVRIIEREASSQA